MIYKGATGIQAADKVNVGSDRKERASQLPAYGNAKLQNGQSGPVEAAMGECQNWTMDNGSLRWPGLINQLFVYIMWTACLHCLSGEDIVSGRTLGRRQTSRGSVMLLCGCYFDMNHLPQPCCRPDTLPCNITTHATSAP